jgi:hypothetical protein
MRHLTATLLAAAFLAVTLTSSASAGARFTTVYSTNGGVPAGLVPARGAVYGRISTGTCFSIDELQPPGARGGAWSLAIVYTFTGSTNGCYLSDPAAGAHGTLYGLFAPEADAPAAMFELQPPAAPGGAWAETTALSSSLLVGGAPLVGGSGGSFYTLGNTGFGGLLQLLPPAGPGQPWSPVVLWVAKTECEGPGFVPGPDGSLYGTSEFNLCNLGSKGNVFQLRPPAAPGGQWHYEVIHDFSRHSVLANPSSLAVASDGTLYGTTLGSAASGIPGNGGVYRLQPPASGNGAWTYTLLKDFGGAAIVEPQLVTQDGNLYGGFNRETETGVPYGLIFEMQPPSAPGGAWTTTYLHRWTNGQIPHELVVDDDGTIFGTTGACVGGSCSGTIFRITTK